MNEENVKNETVVTDENVSKKRDNNENKKSISFILYCLKNALPLHPISRIGK